ncbi:MAG: transcription elongation factor GreA [Segetibacter sp.]|nr:transcription elongation factor GreA [Segetibacter sp.]
MTATKSKIIITKEDYSTLNSYITNLRSVRYFDGENAASLQEELRKATLVKSEEMPVDVVRLNSRVIVKEGTTDKLIELVLVVPEKADIKEKRISVLAPIGTALIGFREGEKVSWDVPAGSRTFTIIKVYNQQG